MIELMLRARPEDRIKKTTYSVREEDYQLIRKVFPETGFISYFPGFAMRLLADELRRREITEPNERAEFYQLSGVPVLLQSIKFVEEEKGAEQ